MESRVCSIYLPVSCLDVMKPGVFSVHLVLKQEKFGAHALHAAHKNRKNFEFSFPKKKKRERLNMNVALLTRTLALNYVIYIVISM